MRKSAFLLSLVATLFVACGGDTGPEDDAFRPPPDGSSGGGATGVSSLSLVTSSPTLASDGATPVEITAFVRNASNQFMASVPVTFSADSGGLQVTQGTTDQNGMARATLTPAGDPSSRSITVTAMAGNQTDTVSVAVAGTTLSVQGPTNLAQNQQGTYTVALLNAGGTGIANGTVTVTSARNNTLSPASVTTDSTGRGTFNMTAVSNQSDTLTVSGQGVTSTLAVAVNSNAFSMSMTPTGDLALGTPRTITVNWPTGNGMQVLFSTTRGTITPSATVAGGVATATIQSSNAGPAIISAQGINAGAVVATAQLPLEFIATTPASIDVQPSQFTVQVGQSSTITAVVRDAAGNLVKNQTVTFTLTDVTGGSLSSAAGVTDSQGRAQSVYTAGSTTSANEGVVITATVAGVAPQSVALTVGGRQVFISVGTGNEVAEPNPAQYRLDFVVQVTDSNGNGVSGVPVSLRILSNRYFKGQRAAAAPPATGWGTSHSIPAGCLDEDQLVPSTARNGTLDPGEDFNSSGRIEAGNIALVSPSNGSTDASGFLLVSVFYPQEYAYYLEVDLSASATVQGTEYVRTSRFMVPGSAPDFNNTNQAPPGIVSPFGTGGSCADTL